MKRFATILLALTMLASVGSTVYAEAPSDEGSKEAEFPYEGTDLIGVYGIYEPAPTPDTVYSVLVEWDSLEFNCTVSGTATWHPGDHTYDNQRTFSWNGLSGVDPLNPDNKNTKLERTIRVTNNSNVDVYAKAALENAESKYGIGLSVYPVNTSVPVHNRAYNHEQKNNEIFTVTLRPPTTPDVSMPNEAFTVGTVMITVSAESLDGS